MGKSVFHRPRPDTALYRENSFSFPSGHATIAIAFYGFLAYILIREIKQLNKKINVFFSCFIIVLLIGFSRLYLEVHYMSDIWGGYLAGFIWLIIAIGFSEFIYSKRDIVQTTASKKIKQIISIFLVVPAIGVYATFVSCYRMPGPIPSEKAGWSLADNVSISSISKIVQAFILKHPYSKAPMTPDFWNTEVHDFGFEKSTKINRVQERHHTCFWKTNYIIKNGDMIYVDTASFDSGIRWGVAHKINPAIDLEREFLFLNLQKTRKVYSFEKKNCRSCTGKKF